jgi:chemotaxis signal transduction protein
MNTYLQVRAAGYTLLVDSRQIRDVMVNQDGNAVTECPDRRVWRGRTLPTVDLPEALGSTRAPRPMAVVLEEENGQGAIILDVDGAGPMLRFEDTAFRRLPPLPSAVGRTFDALLVAGDGQAGMLRVRRGAAFTLLSGAAAPEARSR